MKSNNAKLILIAEDDEEDRMLEKDALEESGLRNPLYFVKDGEELMLYLKNHPPFEDHEKFPQPGLILLDLNMPKKDGREAAHEIKANYELRKIPLIILTTSKAEEDILKTYDLGVNSFITKPVTYEGLVEVMKSLGNYWFETVILPPENINN